MTWEWWRVVWVEVVMRESMGSEVVNGSRGRRIGGVSNGGGAR